MSSMIDIFSFRPVCIIRFAHFKDPPKCAKQHVLVHSHYHPSHSSFRAFQGPPEMRETTRPGPPEMHETTRSGPPEMRETTCPGPPEMRETTCPGPPEMREITCPALVIFTTTATMYYATHAS
ncbi:hypothetical protein HD554DRAFT_2042293 [Boletus coccyginus]|nr:hypothetical protein HD554DRAFT_2042293 [Boletus coccyginus]